MRSRGVLAAVVVIACAPAPAVAGAAESVPGQVIVRFESGAVLHTYRLAGS